MPKKQEETTLLQSLFDCFASSKTVIRYVFERESDGHVKYTLPLNNVIDTWELVYSKSIVSLSIAPRSHSKKLSKDSLSAFTRHDFNDKNKSIVEKNILPHFSGPKCSDLLSEEVLHLNHTIDLGVRAAQSPWERYADSLPGEKLKGSEEVQIFFDDAVSFLMHLFLGEPYEILSRKYPWFARIVSPAGNPEIQRFSNQQVLSLFACALVLSLNVTDSAQINDNIDAFLRSVFSGELSGSDPEEASPPAKKEEEEPPHTASASFGSAPRTDNDDVIRVASKMIHFRDKRHPKIGAEMELEIRDIIDDLEQGVYEDFFGISAKLWEEYDKKTRAQTIYNIYEIFSDDSYDLTTDNSHVKVLKE